MNQYLRRKIWTLNRSGKFRGYLRTVSGYPVTLTDCMAGQPVSMAVDGNAVQDGTPTPDNPVDVQLCGDRTANLLDVRAFEDTTNSSSLSIQLTPNMIYTFGYNAVVSVVYVYAINESGEATQLSRTEIGNRIINFQTEATGKIRINLTKPSKRETLLSTWMLIEGAYTAETMPAYEPYGYKVPLTMTGMNLLSNNENDWVGDAGIYKHFKIPVEGTTTLQVKIKEGKSIPKKLYLGYSKNGMDATGGITWLIDNGIIYGAPIRTSELKYISIHPKTALLDEIFDSLDIMLIEGAYTTETMPAYEPYQPPQDFAVYLPEQIAKVGDVADEVVVDMENRTAELKKNVGSMTMSDSYSGGISTTDELVRFWHDTTPRRRISPSANIIDVMSDIYEADTWNNIGAGSTDKQFVIAGNPNTQVVNVRVPKSVIGGETDELMNAWAANNPATVYYVLATPVTTDITSLQQWDAMPSLWSGTAVITADTVIAPSAITAKYYASKPEEVN